ncbi:SGNH/GDSL hydrolase family protein [Curtobacterium sp. Csp1]|uniref:SGNH/GDSL hydrolase family protein n=1 Tax=Curtobacterium sp. Csp1 TaxID=2495429 RepID=UPI00159A3F85|nr:SGNH/GDSL hydrolase family protein [Curtobacterium sp. Csp1]QKS21007.1 SGNH/GDSL hydrolase family protein [Curtobacterium sp. Csp1]
MATTYSEIRVRRGSLEWFQGENRVYGPGEPLHVIDATHNDWLSGDGVRDFNTLWGDTNAIAGRAATSATAASSSASAAATSATAAAKSASDAAGSAAVGDAAVAGYVGNASSASRAELDKRYAGLGGSPVSGTSVYRQRYAKAKTSAISTFLSKLGARHQTPCDIVIIGDSYTEGEGATARAFRFVNAFRDRIRAFHPTGGVAGGSNYLTANPIIASYPKDPSGSYTSDFRFGFGKRGVQLAAGTPITFTVSATSVRIAWLRDTGTGSFTYSVNGGATTTVNTSGAHADGQTTTIAGLSGVTDTITIALNSGYVIIEGLYVYNGDETRGIRVWESGHFGWTAANFISTPSGGTATDWLAHVTNVQPSLVVVELGENDATKVSAATYQSNLSTLISNVKAACTAAPSIVLVAGPERNNTLVEAWANYVAAMKSIASNDSTIDVLDLTTVLPKVNGAPAGWYADSVHPSNRGHAEIATALVEFITP